MAIYVKNENSVKGMLEPNNYIQGYNSVLDLFLSVINANKYSLRIEIVDGKYVLTELMPYALERYFRDSMLVSEVDDTNFDEYNFSNKPVEVLNIVKYNNMLEELEKYQEQGLLTINRYDEKRDLSMLLDECKNTDRLVLFHPELMEDINKRFNKNYSKKDIINLFHEYISIGYRNPMTFVLLNHICDVIPEIKPYLVGDVASKYTVGGNNDFIVISTAEVDDKIDFLLSELEERKVIIEDALGTENKDKIIVNLFEYKQDYSLFTKLYSGQYNNGRKAFFPNNRMINDWTGAKVNIVRTADEVSHELSHIYYHDIYTKQDKRVFWFDEGLAMYLSKEKSTLNNEIEFRNWFIDRILRRDRVIPQASDLLNYDDNYKKGNMGQRLSYLMVRYLFETNQDIKSLLSDLDKTSELTESILNDAVKYYSNKYQVVDNLYQSKSLQDTMDYLNKNIIYGYVTEDGEVVPEVIDGLEDKGIVQSYESVLEHQTGMCIDQGKLIAHILYNFGYDVRFFYHHPEGEYKNSSHLIVIGEDLDTHKYVVYEHTNIPKRGLHYFDTLEEALEVVTKSSYQDRILTELPTVPDNIPFSEFVEFVRNIDEENKKTL